MVIFFINEIIYKKKSYNCMLTNQDLAILLHNSDHSYKKKKTNNLIE